VKPEGVAQGRRLSMLLAVCAVALVCIAVTLVLR